MVALPVDDVTTEEPDTRRITEHDPALKRLKARTERELSASIQQLVADLRRGEPVGQAQSHFIQRHLVILRNAYAEAHREGQRDYYQGVSRTPAKWIADEPDHMTLQRRMLFYAPSVAKMAHEAARAYEASKAQSAQTSLTEPSGDDTETVKLYNPYPRQKGGLFGFGGPGHGLGGGGGVHGLGAVGAHTSSAAAVGGSGGGGGGGGTAGAKAAKPAAAKAPKKPAAPKAPKAPKAVKAPKIEMPKEPTKEELQKAAEARLAKAKSGLSTAEKALKAAEKESQGLREAHKDEISRLQAEHHNAYVKHFEAHGIAREDLLNARATARGEAGKAAKAYARMKAAKEPYEQAKATYEAAKAKATASREHYDKLFDQYSGQYYKPGQDSYSAYNRMMKAHPDLKAAEKARWSDERFAQSRAVEGKYYTLKGRYESARATVAGEGTKGKLTDAEIEAHPLRVSAKAELDAVSARLSAATGEGKVREAFQARETAKRELASAQAAVRHPSWKYPLNNEPTHAAAYTKLEHWPAEKLDAARSAERLGKQREQNGEAARHIGDLALRELQHEQGFDGKPNIVTEADLEAGIKTGDHEIWRGDTKIEHTDNFMMGEYHAGLGIRGNGTYTQMAAHDGPGVAKSYASAFGAGGARSRGSNQDGMIMRMSLKADAKIVDYKTLGEMRIRASQKATRALEAAEAAGNREAIRVAKALKWLTEGDSSRFATALGYDGIRIEEHGQMIILNRTALRISNQLRGVNEV